MAATVKIQYEIGGEGAVLRSFKTILQAAQAQGKEQVKVARETSKAIAKANDNNSPKAAAANFAQAARLAKQAADQKISEARRGAEGAAREAKRGLEKMARDHATAARQKEAKDIASANRSVAKIIREIEAKERAEKRAEVRSATVRRVEEKRGHRIVQANEFARIDDINHRRGAIRGALGDSIKRGVGTGVGVIGAGAALAGGYLGTNTVLDAGRAQLDLGKRAALLNNATDGKAGDTVALAKSISNVVGEDAGGIMGGIEKIAAKSGAGGLEETKGELLEIMKLAKGAGVSMEDMGDVTATLANRGIKSGQFVKVLAAMVQQGKDGAVEFKDLATQLDSSSGALSKFKMSGESRTMVAGGLTQLSRFAGKSSAAEATNSVVDLARDLNGKSTQIKKLAGIDVAVKGSKGSQLKDITTLLPDIIEGIVKKGNGAKLEGANGIFTGNSTSITTPLMQAFVQGLKKDKTTGRYEAVGEGETADIKGREATVALLKQYNDATQSAADSAAAFARIMATQSEQTSVAMNKLKNDLGEKLVPVIAKATPQIVKLITAFGEITAWALSNPFKAVGALMLASIGKSLAGTAFDKLVDVAMNKLVPNMNVQAGNVNIVGGAGAAGALGGAGGGALKAGANATTAFGVLAAGAAGYGVGTEVASSANKDLAGMDTRGAALESYSIAGAMNAGKGTKADRERAAVLLQKMQGEQSKGVVGRFGEGVMAGGKGLLNGDVSLGNVASMLPPVALARGAYQATLGDQQAGNDSTTRDAIKELQAALAKPVEQPDVVAAVNALGASINNAQLQQPKAPAP